MQLFINIKDKGREEYYNKTYEVLMKKTEQLDDSDISGICVLSDVINYQGHYNRKIEHWIK